MKNCKPVISKRSNTENFFLNSTMKLNISIFFAIGIKDQNTKMY